MNLRSVVKIYLPCTLSHRRPFNFSSRFYSQDEEKTVNVFTIVSGATYERLALIMIFSVIKNTTAPVKFWLISNFVTSRFRDALEKLSSRLKFEFELFRFHWPRWLNPQWRKHRRVWAHKILFLDAFPYSIKRLIYIDADQVMRGDVSQLAKIDLNGRVYGFVPFCDSRKESIPLQFWKSGYWHDYLRGLPYHISALFVIDMPRFRTESVGERLRAQYQPLSFDPASLANLDQDLPNNLQHEVPIHSLPSEWLWCETWCDEKSKGKAKSIDLCSNPLKKESKLEQAKRIIPEWKEYDQEIQAILAEGSSESDHDEL
jgi:UDP-glucose:glycoprotein glucosyltransferase